jgi:hypothetical protein
MRIARSSVTTLALVLGLALVAPASAFGQNNLHQLGIAAIVPASGDEQIRVTVGNPSGGGTIDGSGEAVVIVGAGPGAGGHVRHTLEPGASYTYTLDPRVVGRSADSRWDLFHVPVSLRIEAESVDGRPAAQAAVTIEVVDARTGALRSVHVVPGFTGGAPLAAADLD